MVDKKFLAGIVKEIKSYSRDEDYPLVARVENEQAKRFEITIWYPTRLGEYSIVSVHLSGSELLDRPPGKLYIRDEGDTSRTPWDRYEDDNFLVSEKDFLKVLARLKKKADKQITETKVHTIRDVNGIAVYKGLKKIGEVWKGMDKKWHHSGKSAEYAGFRTRKEAMEDLLKPPSQRTMDYQPFDGYPRIASAKELLKEVLSIKASLRLS